MTGFRCPICHGRYLTGQCEPVMMPRCGHSLCRPCLFKLISITCPTCKADYNGLYLEQLPTNIGLLDLAKEQNLSTINSDRKSVTSGLSNPAIPSAPPMSAGSRSLNGPLQSSAPPMSAQSRSIIGTFPQSVPSISAKSRSLSGSLQPSASPMSPPSIGFSDYSHNHLLLQAQLLPQYRGNNNNNISNVDESRTVGEQGSSRPTASRYSPARDQILPPVHDEQYPIAVQFKVSNQNFFPKVKPIKDPKYKIIISILFSIFIGFSPCMIIIGSLNWRNCPAQTFIPIWLVVNGITGIIFGIQIATHLIYGRPTRISAMVQDIFWAINIPFQTIWFIMGCVFVYEIFWPNYKLPYDEKYCDFLLYTFSYWFLTISWGFVMVCFIVITIRLIYITGTLKSVILSTPVLVFAMIIVIAGIIERNSCYIYHVPIWLITMGCFLFFVTLHFTIGSKMKWTKYFRIPYGLFFIAWVITGFFWVYTMIVNECKVGSLLYYISIVSVGLCLITMLLIKMYAFYSI
ncbi:unnamed protein product, partial [Meganyctiphanes norvegica]